MSNLSRLKPLPPPSLERLYLTEDRELGIGASDISDEAKRRHFTRYATVIQLIKGHVGRKDLVVDVGCGSGYGTNMMAQHFRRVIGIEPDNKARLYAAKHFPEVLFANDLGDLRADVVVMVESIEHMSKGEAKMYLEDAKVLALTTPLIEHAHNEFHEQSFKTAEDVHLYVQKFGFTLSAVKVWQGITFTTGETGNNLVATYTRAR